MGVKLPRWVNHSLPLAISLSLGAFACFRELPFVASTRTTHRQPRLGVASPVGASPETPGANPKPALHHFLPRLLITGLQIT
jgi:hypothetical protein